MFRAFESVGEEVGQQIQDIRETFEDLLEETLTQPQGWSLDSLSDDIAEEFPSLSPGEAETIARTESASVLNEAREEGYESRDDSTDYIYKWVGPDDSRTTPACEELKDLTNPDFGGSPVDMSTLKRLERDVQNKYFTRLDYREHLIHPNERHTFRRVLPHEVDEIKSTDPTVDSTVRKDLPESVFEEIAESRFIPPQGAADEARQALEWIDEHGRDEAEGATEEGIGRARQIIRHVEEDDPLTGTNDEGTPYVVEIANFFARHRDNRDIADEFEGEPWKDNGYLSWLLWGGDPADEWATALKERLEEVGYLKAASGCCGDDADGDYAELLSRAATVTKSRTTREREIESALDEPVPRILNRLLGETGGQIRPALRRLNDRLDEEGVESNVSTATIYSWVEKYRLDTRDYENY